MNTSLDPLILGLRADILAFTPHCALLNGFNGSMPFIPNTTQAEALLMLQSSRITCGIVPTRAEMGEPLLVFAVWKAVLWPGARIFFKTSDPSRDYLLRQAIVRTYEHLPDRIRAHGGEIDASTLSIRFSNGSSIHLGFNRFSLIGVNWPTLLVEDFAYHRMPLSEWLPEARMRILQQRGTLGLFSARPYARSNCPQTEFYDFSDIPVDTMMRVIETGVAD